MTNYAYPIALFITALSMTSPSFAQLSSPSTLSTLSSNDAPLPITIKATDDWVQLISGETLKGELIGTIEKNQNSFDQTIEFDSDDLGDQEIDLEDIKTLKTAHSFKVLLNSGEVHTGALLITGDTLIISNKVQTRVPVNQVVSIYRGVDTEREHWDVDFFIGANFSKGNTDELSIATSVDAERKTVKSRVLLRYASNIAESAGENTARNHIVDGSYDINLSPRLFLRPIKMTVDSDKFQNIAYRINGSMQVGYFLFTQSNFEWDVSLGPGIQYTLFDTVQEGDSDDEMSPTALMSSKIDYELSENIDLSHTYDLNWSTHSAGGIRHTNNLGLDIEMIEDLDFSIKLVWDHLSNPKANSSNITPQKDDYKLNFGLSFAF
ncbi:YdiY family protein [Moritella sp. F3]|uniref:DUF481 domain-containing protein n=1 Tax=Moritella sp. F3 TaxID=2718882 RepID=UPI0018E1602D|nr:DUF481 domain-containing protein [Moritella sp. F3]GIC76847.1 hypothetical protein FMO001_15740 [Moritella sp. F1]GIC81033.1 hypothetical protein FMO003_13140 [Moritella sp. F3]